MPSLVRAKAILPKGVLQPGEIAKAVRNQVTTEGRRIQRALNETVATWRDPPTFVISQRVAPTQSRVVSVTVSPAGTADAVNHFNWVNKGTSVRWAVMHPEFRPKTNPSRLKAGPGNPPFDPLVRGKSQMFRPRPGIEARNFTVKIKAARQPLFSAAVREAIRRALEKRGSTP